MSDPEHLREEAVRLIAVAAGASVVLRALGSIGVALHCGAAAAMLRESGRGPKDIDLVTRKEDRRHLQRLFEAEGYETDRDMLVSMEGHQYLFRHPDRGIAIDVWVDQLAFCHTVDLRGRFGSGPSLTIEDLLLSKLQIVELTGNDQTDIAAILAVHELGRNAEDPEVIDLDYVTGLLADDWGFWKTATTNLERFALGASPEVADSSRRLRDAIEAAPKSLKWKVRSKLGERAQWWQDVDIPRDTY